MTPRPDPWDADLSALHTAVDNLGPWLAIWQARREPDAHARRCAADAVAAADAALAALYRIRAGLVTQVRRADDQAAARVDALLTRKRDGPQGHHSLEAAAPSLDPAAAKTPKPASRVTRGGNGGPAPCEVTAYARTGGDCLHVRDCSYVVPELDWHDLLTRSEAEAYLRKSHDNRRCTVCAPDIPDAPWVRVRSPGGQVRWRLADDVGTP